uniref:Uncharacterized protein n=1 Tax=Candidatus Kentrum sp. SD TaxID=2126332 RepID=A0A450YDA2_9GAMM|nr:MAG: hypothetical protein BECKSD772F_GA0070984_10431 [Candidatus Kentron sp. SD]VFK44777.1 MAG: hypothetical protein BECKSD772E_GA0070983_104320 [Candidatus Kentron sp. SD]
MEFRSRFDRSMDFSRKLEIVDFRFQPNPAMPGQGRDAYTVRKQGQAIRI